MFKTATAQSFGGRRVALTMAALCCVQTRDDNGDVMGVELHAAVCVDFDDEDRPVFRSSKYPNDLFYGYVFVGHEADLVAGTWTWKERV